MKNFIIKLNILRRASILVAFLAASVPLYGRTYSFVTTEMRIRQLEIAFLRFEQMLGELPPLNMWRAELQGLDTATINKKGIVSLDDETILRDAWGRPLEVRYIDTNDSKAKPIVKIYSLGEDGQSLSDGNDLDDINNWDSARTWRVYYINQVNRQYLIGVICKALPFLFLAMAALRWFAARKANNKGLTRPEKS